MGLWPLPISVIPAFAGTTTPRPIPLLKDLEVDSTTIITRGSTYENAANLPPAYTDQIIKRYEGTKFGNQEIMGQVICD